ncbi:MAG TPA: beta-ketoacyl-ACP synthase I, partial [Halothiobacillus sp.]|nr:beta-ketoacyl-ACP synthase I [Halothiobacillus sp.]
MRRVVITGMGIISSLGNNRQEVLESLKQGRSGIVFNPEQAEHGLRSQVAGTLKIDPAEHIDRKLMRFMGAAAAYSYLSMVEAIEHAGLERKEYSSERVGLIVGSGGSSCENIIATAQIAEEKGVKRVGPYMVTRTMSSTTSACLATPFGIKGVNYSISSACATSAHCIGNAYELIQMGKQDMIFAGGGEELHWSQSAMFDAMGALSSNYNDSPETASRPYDVTRDGFVIS